MAPKHESSESLLTEILRMVQELNKNVLNTKRELSVIKKEFGTLHAKIDNTIKAAFVDGDLERHQRAHEQKSWFSWFSRRK